MSRHEEYMKSMARTENIRMQQANKQSDNKDMVNNPPHYNQHGIECLDAIRAATGKGYQYYLQGNILKYLWRYRYKNGKEDLQKALFYLKRMIEEVNES